MANKLVLATAQTLMRIFQIVFLTPLFFLCPPGNLLEAESCHGEQLQEEKESLLSKHLGDHHTPSAFCILF